jgi:hypothetical protein
MIKFSKHTHIFSNHTEIPKIKNTVKKDIMFKVLFPAQIKVHKNINSLKIKYDTLIKLYDSY